MSGDPTNEVRGFYVRIPWEQNGDDALESAVGFEIKPGTPMSDSLKAMALLGADPETVGALSRGNPGALSKARESPRRMAAASDYVPPSDEMLREQARQIFCRPGASRIF